MIQIKLTIGEGCSTYGTAKATLPEGFSGDVIAEIVGQLWNLANAEATQARDASKGEANED